MRSLLVVLAVLIVAVAAQLPERVSNGFFEGRSGDLLLKPSLTRDESVMMFLNAEDSNVPVPTQQLSLRETHVADLLSHLVGTAPLNPQVDRTNFPKKGFFNNPKANLLFVLDSTATVPATGLKHTISSESYPDETITALTSILTGATPSAHGIIGDAWLNRETGEKVSAFESWCPTRSSSRSATLQDVFGLAYGGRSLVLSFASKLNMARVLSTKPFLLKPTTPNYGFFWSGQSFDSVYSGKTKYTADMELLVAQLAMLRDSPLSVTETLTVDVEGQKVVLDLNEPEVLALVAEFSYAFYLMNLLTTDTELKSLVNDEVPDFFTFGFTSVKDLQAKYGKGSLEMKAVSVAVNFAMSKVVETLNSLYQGKLLAEAVFLGSNEEAAGFDRQQLLEKTKTTLVSQLADEEHLVDYYPDVYLNAEVTSEQKKEACSFLQQVLSPASVDVYCLPDPAEFRSLRADLGNSSGDGDGDGDGTVENEMEIFQIVLWSSVVLILVTIWASAVMFTIDASKDTMLYNQHSQINIKTIS